MSQKRADEELCDGALVRAVQAGNPEPFGQLVERYLGLVISMSQELLGSAEDASEAAQNALLAALGRIASLRQPERFRSWLVAIARNEAITLRYRRQRERIKMGLGLGTTVSAPPELLNGLVGSPVLQGAQANELAEIVRSTVSRLRADQAEVVRLFYLEGRPVKEIANTLNRPEGTVKSLLFHARSHLRKDLTMSELTDNMRHETTRHPILDVKGIWGSSGSRADLHPAEVCKTLLAQQILVALRKSSLDAASLAEQVKADVSYVHEHLDKMVEAGIVVPERKAYRAGYLLLMKEDLQAWDERYDSKADQIAEVLRQRLGDLQKVIKQLRPSEQGVDEARLRWAVIVTMILNFGVKRALSDRGMLKRELPVRPDGGRWHFMPRALDGGVQVEFGCNCHLGNNGAAQYWSYLTPRPGWSSTDEFVARRLAATAVSTNTLAELFTPEELAKMIDSGLIVRRGDQFACAVPVFTPKDGTALKESIDSTTAALCDGPLASFPNDLYAALDRIGFAKVRDDYPTWAADLPMRGVARALIDRAVLPAPPQPFPRHWGLFLWEGLFAPM